MSIESWKAEFYPVPADEVPVDQAITHSLRKWEGLRKENLDRHELTRIRRRITSRSGSEFRVDGSSCALCHRYLVDGDGDAYDVSCDDCPLSIERDGVACDNLFNNEEVSPWNEFDEKGNPEPMIFWLNAAQAKIEPDSTA
jgi:hypothetical protein